MTIYGNTVLYEYDGAVMPGRRAGSGVGSYIAESPKQGNKKVQLYYEDDSL